MKGKLSLLSRITHQVNSRAHSRTSENTQILEKILCKEKL